MKLGMIGLGRMGANMSSRLLKAGHEIVAFDRNADKVQALAREGAIGAASLEELVQKLEQANVLKGNAYGPRNLGVALVLVGIGMLVLGWNSDRTRERRWHFAAPQLTAAFGLAIWFFLPHSTALLMVVFTLIGFGSVAYLPAFWALPSAFLTSSAAAAAVGFINCTASIGGFVGPKIFGDLSQRTGSFNTGFAVMIACWIIASLLVLLCPRERTE